jgi:hypothetical protein
MINNYKEHKVQENGISSQNVFEIMANAKYNEKNVIQFHLARRCLK